MIEDVRTVRRCLEDTYAQSQEAIEATAAKLYEKDPAQAKAFSY
jgi:hypothetical protein